MQILLPNPQVVKEHPPVNNPRCREKPAASQAWAGWDFQGAPGDL